MNATCPALLSSFATSGKGPGTGTFCAGRFGVAGLYGPFDDGLAEGLDFEELSPVLLLDVSSFLASFSLGLTDGETEVAASTGFASSLDPQAASPETSVSVRAVAIAVCLRFVMMAPLWHVFLLEPKVANRTQKHHRRAKENLSFIARLEPERSNFLINTRKLDAGEPFVLRSLCPVPRKALDLKLARSVKHTQNRECNSVHSTVKERLISAFHATRIKPSRNATRAATTA